MIPNNLRALIMVANPQHMLLNNRVVTTDGSRRLKVTKGGAGNLKERFWRSNLKPAAQSMQWTQFLLQRMTIDAGLVKELEARTGKVLEISSKLTHTVQKISQKVDGL
jgi:hypothetical protein